MNRCFKSIFNRALGVWQVTSELTTGAGRGSGKSGSVVMSGAPSMSAFAQTASSDRLDVGTGSHRKVVSRSVRLALMSMSMLGMQIYSGAAHAGCTQAGLIFTCTGPSVTNYVSATNSVMAIILSDAVMGVPLLLGGNAITLTGNKITLSNQGTIDPSTVSGLAQVSGGIAVGNGTVGGNAISISNMGGGTIRGLTDSNAITALGGQAIQVQNATGGITTIQNDGTIGQALLGFTGFTTADAIAIISYGGGQTNLTNTGTITGRIGFGASNTANQGNTFLNAGTINGSVHMGDTATGNTFTAVSGSSVINAGISVSAAITGLNVVLSGAGVVDGGLGANNRLILQNSATGTGSGTGGAVTAIDAANYLHFQRLTINSGTWNLSGAVSSGDATINDGLVNFNNAGVFGTGVLNVNGGAIAASTAGLTLANNVSINTGTFTLGGTNAFGLSGILSGAGGLTVTDTAPVTLSGANLFSGGVNLNAGGLLLGNSSALGTGTLSVGGAVTLDGSTALSLANNVNLGTGASLNVLGGQPLSFNGVLSGAGSLTKNGSATLTLNGANTFIGGTTLNAGGLVVGNNAALGSGTLTVGGATTLDSSTAVILANAIALNGGLTVLGTNDLTLNGNIAGTGSLTKNGAATLTLNGSSTYTGGTNINAGTLALGIGASLASSGVVNLASGATFDLSAGNGTQTFGTLIGGGTVILGVNALTIGGASNGAFSGSIGGTGGLTKEGVGMQTLTGANSFTGGTLINAGTLAIGAGGSLAATGAVTLAAVGTGFDISAGGNQAIGVLNGVAGSTVALGGNTLTLGGAVNGIYNGVIAGTGGLVKNGAAVQTLGGANTFSGGVALNAGGLSLGNNSALGTGVLTVGGNASLDNSASLNVANNVNLAGGNLNVLGSNALTLGGVISGSGGLTKNGTSTLTLTGSNTYTGGTTINNGTLAIGAGGSLATTGVVNFTGAGTLDISAGGNQTIASLAGVAGNAIALGGNTLTFGDAGNAAFNGTIGGGGGLVKNGSGMQTLGGANTFSGGVTLNAGGLNVGNNAALGTGALTVGGASALDSGSAVTLRNDVVLNAVLSVSGSNAMNLNGILSGAGGLTKNGNATLTLNGSNTYTGGTTINAGTLRINNTNNSAFIVNSGGMLAGTGSVASLVNNATVQVEAGTLAVNGNYSQGAGGILRVDAASSAQYGKLNVTGTATFGAAAKIDVNVNSINTLASGNILSSIITAGTLNASTFDVTDNSAIFNFSAVLNGNAVDLTTQLGVTTTGAVAASGASSAAGAAGVLDSLLTGGASGDMANVVTALGSLGTQREVSRAVAQTLPLNGGTSQSTLGMLGGFNSVVQGRVSSVGGGGGNNTLGSSGASGVSTGENPANRHVWGKAFGSRASQDDSNGSSGFSANSWGTAFGADNMLTQDTLLGISYGYANSRVDGNTALSGTAQRANIDSNVLGIYGSTALPNAMQLNFQGDVSRNHTSGSRNINFGGLNATATSSYASYSAHAGAGLSKDIALAARTTFTPEVRFDYTRLRAQGYSESGAGALNLSVGASTTSAFVLGAQGRLRQDLTRHSWLNFNFGAGYDAINDRGDVVSVFAGAPGQSFATTGLSHSPWLMNLGVGYTYQANAGAEVTLRYDADGRDGYLNQTASVKAGWMF